MTLKQRLIESDEAEALAARKESVAQLQRLEAEHLRAQADATEAYHRACKKGSARQAYLEADRALQLALRLARETYNRIRLALAEEAHAPQGATPQQKRNARHLDRHGWTGH